MTWLRHPLAFLAFTLLSGLFSLSLYSSWRRNQASNGQLAQVEQQIQDMTHQVNTLQLQVETASNSANQEKIIRDQLLMQKPGEQVIQIQEINGENENLVSATPSPKPWDEWQKLLFE